MFHIWCKINDTYLSLAKLQISPQIYVMGSSYSENNVHKADNMRI